MKDFLKKMFSSVKVQLLVLAAVLVLVGQLLHVDLPALLDSLQAVADKLEAMGAVDVPVSDLSDADKVLEPLTTP